MESGLICPSCGTHIHPPAQSSLDLTRVERVTLHAITSTVAARGEPLTIDEVCEARGRASKGRAHQIIGALREKGYLVPAARGRKRTVAPSQKAWALYAISIQKGDTHVG